MDYPRITVVTPSYNQGQFIEQTILSVINQNYPNLEYFVIDGFSTDNTVEIIKKYESRISYWVSEKDNGQTEAINKGMRRATGDIVCWINSDDMLLPGALMLVGKYFIEHPEVTFLNGLTVEIDKTDQILKVTHILMNKFFFMHGAYNISQPGMFWKRTLFDKVGYLDETFHAMMDVEWLIRVYESGVTVKLLNRPIGAIRIYAETKTAMKGNIWSIDADKINRMYNGKYTFSRSSIYFLLFAIVKLINGCYLKNYLFNLRNKGKKLNALEID